MPLDNLRHARRHRLPLSLYLLMLLIVKVIELRLRTNPLVAPSPEIDTPVAILVLARIASLTIVR
jgi:hypothetical protein